MDGCMFDEDDDGVEDVDGDGVDGDVLIEANPNCDVDVSFGMNVKQLTLDLRLSENHRVLSPLVRNIVMP